jgi:MarR family transcriptional regulator, transcriptional regulator for hemolysin
MVNQREYKTASYKVNSHKVIRYRGGKQPLYMEASSQASNLGHWVKVINHDTTVKMNRLLKPFGLTRSSWSVLYQVNRAGRISQKTLQEDLGIESGSMAIVADGLVRKGWLERTSSEKDRRANYLELTPKGTARWKAVPDIATVMRKEMMRGVTEEEESAAVATLKKCSANLAKEIND